MPAHMFISRRQTRTRNPRNSSNSHSRRTRTLAHRQSLLGWTISRSSSRASTSNTPSSSNNLSRARRAHHTRTSTSWYCRSRRNSTRRASSRGRCARHPLTAIHLAQTIRPSKCLSRERSAGVELVRACCGSGGGEELEDFFEDDERAY
jgi:hypothetical protein